MIKGQWRVINGEITHLDLEALIQQQIHLAKQLAI